MIEKRTVFILGAGASWPYGFPTGSELVDKIRDSFISSSQEQLLSVARKIDRRADAQKFVEVLTKSRTQSIDLFLSRNPEFATVGKIAIVCTILAVERASLFRPQMPIEKTQFDWYTDLLGRLTDGLTRKADYSRLADNKISFITFNYDRSLEHFMLESLIHSFYGIAPEDIQRVLQTMPIIHVYGQVVPLDWQESCDGKQKIPYRMNVDHINVPDLIDNLHVIYDERCNPDLEKARELISQAERIFFLGFGYARENLEVLDFPRVLKPTHLIYGTALERTPREIEEIKTDFVHGLQQSASNPIDRPIGAQARVKIEPCDSVALLREFL